MAGGSGTRFWPKSRAKKPKQLLGLWDDRSLLKHTVERFTKMVPSKNIWIVTTEALVEPSKKALGPEFENVHFLGEPRGQNTAPCILWGIQEIRRVCGHAVIAVMPADHYIGAPEAFYQAVEAALKKARYTNSIVTLGVKPTRPETGYGYIEVTEKVNEVRNVDVKAVSAFIEKPNLETAMRYEKSGKHFWNAGMFIFSVQSGHEAFQKTMPDLVRVFESGARIRDIYDSIPKTAAVSVDYGVMEKAAGNGIPVFVVPVDCDWNDVGSFTALEEINRSILGETIQIESKNNIVNSDSGLVALLGVENLVVVRSGDVVLVTTKDRAQDIKKLVDVVREKYPDKA